MRAHVVIDSQDPERIAPFWCGLLEMEVRNTAADGRYVVLTGMRDRSMMVLQRVPEPKEGKNRVHLDVLVDDLDETTKRAEALGGLWSEPGKTRELDGVLWRIMSDPDGNEFCLYVAPPA